MHTAAVEWVRRKANLEAPSVLDIGGRNINGTCQPIFPRALYRTLDILPGCDIQADAATWTPDRSYALVLATEVFEHAEQWREIVKTAFCALMPGGLFIATMAGPGRSVHSGYDGSTTLKPGEHYANINASDLREALGIAGFEDIVIDSQEAPSDVRCCAKKPLHRESMMGTNAPESGEQQSQQQHITGTGSHALPPLSRPQETEGPTNG